MRDIKKYLTIFASIGVMILLSACSFISNETSSIVIDKKSELIEQENNFIKEKEQSSLTTITFQDGKFSFEIPENWKENTKDDYFLEVIRLNNNNREEAYILTYVDAREDFISFEAWLERTKWINLDLNDNYTISEPLYLEINGNPAVQYIVEAEFEIINYVDILTFIEGETYFVEIVASTYRSRFNELEDELQQIIRSIRGL